MCKSPLHSLLVALPKCEHHMHLEGSLSPELLFRLAAKNSISLPQSDPAFESVESLYARYAAFTSLDDFLGYYYIGFSVLLTQSDFEELSYTYLSRAASSNVRHTEVFFDPQAHLSRGVAVSTIIGGFQAASQRAETELGISSLLIPCLLRHLPVENSAACFGEMLSANLFSSQGSGGVLAGLGLCSTEIAKPPSVWKDIFALAEANGIRRTSHAGEEGPAEYVAKALDDLHAMRIDHGVHAADDEGLLEKLAVQKIMLTVCPVSNVRLRGVDDIKEVPIRRFLEKGVRFSLNSDDPAYFGAYIQEVYCQTEDAFGLSVDEWGMIARNAVEGSWCDDTRKGEILRDIGGVLGDWKKTTKD
ncbi:adenosine deaminase [Apodospora peruviana]|uniref:Adenine deaminase n=1 Tax=Apodospora peruviana TaxID=516989 RepID=A0AAE0HZ99_9PEZI|nr:adenosine deaminase [Apodospora peruviana]